LVVAVHPEDAALAEEALPGVVARLRAGAHAELVEDAGLSRGSAVVRTPGGGAVDASIDAQVERMVRALLPGREPRGGSGPGAAPAAEGGGSAPPGGGEA